MIQPLMSKFPGPLTLYPSRAKWIVFFAGSAIFVAITVWALATRRDGSAIMWFGLVVFTVCSIVFATNLIPGSSSLTLTRDGCEMKQFYYVRRTRWQTVTNISAGKISSSSMETVRYNDSAFSGWKLARLETAALGYNAMLPDTYGMTADDLAALMTQWQDRALAPVF